jgi:hypothetical protein
MLRTRLAWLALTAGLSLTSGCMNFPRPFGCFGSGGCCCPPANGCCDGVVASFGGVAGTPCCGSHAAMPGAVEGPVLMPHNGAPPVSVGNGAPPVGGGNGVLTPIPNPNLVPPPHAPATPYTP